ncbi:hypothetical protein SAMN05444159_6054 [Bradyrhizobium lablabi]|uniref:Neutral/alkaline non-lysosomal ceramidase N-terminal domain-containing protein n=1 Tax=Bradyrhizobium lablabi TaxID=722472 RepID=A0A1M7B5R5_9BRAD|nr:hypothetical protein [Bradyrhizobium lablabi]SHL50254.1 hypothetical protein SAMN05444159_6054 [Bradyrhizobium lablabi]
MRKAPVTTILDPIEISAVLLECAAQRCLIFSFDLMIVGSELQDAILAKLQRMGFEPDEVMLLASHTHTAPATDQACERLGIPDTAFVGDLAAAAENLVRQIQQRQPAEVSFEVFRGRLDHSVSRRRFWPFPTYGRMYGLRFTSIAFAPNPSAPRDEQATVALLRASNGKVVGLIWHYTCHPTAAVPQDVISADYPGAVRRALRARFGEIPCVFAQGFCGDTRPNIKTSARRNGWRERFRRMIRLIMSGPLFVPPSADDWTRWSQSLAEGVCAIAQGKPVQRFSPASLQTGSARIALSEFFTGSTPDKMLAAQAVRIGEDLEIVSLSAEPSVEWQRTLDEAVPVAPGRIRLYAGYLGALFGYLPTAAQIPQGGYEVEGFQPLFGLSGHFKPDRISPAIAGCVRDAFADLERAKLRTTDPLPLPAQ